MSGGLALDFAAWEDHARWWETESAQVRARLGVDDDTLAAAPHVFGRIGTSTVGAAYATTLAERRAAGERLATYAENVAAHIRRDLQTYADTEAENQQALGS